MKCANCDNPLVPGARFCGKCGTLAPVTHTYAEPAAAKDDKSEEHTVVAVRKGHPATRHATPHHEKPALEHPAAPAATHPDTTPGPEYPFGDQLSHRNYLTAFLLAAFLGGFGIDRFYTGHIGAGILKLLTSGGFGLWWYLDMILLLAGVRGDQYGRRLWGRSKGFKASVWVFVAVTILTLLTFAGFIVMVILAAQDPASGQTMFKTAP